MAAFGRFSSERVTTLFHFLALSHNKIQFIFYSVLKEKFLSFPPLILIHCGVPLLENSIFYQL